MDGKKSGLRMIMRPAAEVSQFHIAASGIPVGVIVVLGLALTFCDWFPSADVQWWQLFTGMLAAAIVLWLLQLTGKGRWICIGALATVVLLCILVHDRVLAGFGCLGNDVLQRLTRVTGLIYLDFAVGSKDSVLWAAAAVLSMAVLMLMLSLQTGKLLFLLPLLLPVYGAVLAGIFPVGVGPALLGLGIVLILMRGSGAKVNAQGFWGIPSWLAVVTMCILLAAGAGLWLGESDGNSENRALKEALHELFWDEETNSMPEGELNNLSSWNKSGTPALEITMSEPQKLYLRGQVYETYTGTRWEQLSAEAQAEYESLFYWLHQSDFYGQSQIGTASAFTAQTKSSELTIRNLSACSGHGYYPYALFGSETLDADRIGDANFPEAESLTYLTGSVPEWYAVQQDLYSAQNRNNVSRYLAAEKAYEEYVTAVDIQLTNESWSVLNRQLGAEASAKTLSQIREFIRTYLADTLVYDEEVKTLNAGGDFLQHTLEKSGSGYSVHYATAATLMLRYFGVPARYVEGYFISAEEAEAYRAGETIILTEEHAHAWTEYYLPGVGFVPFEVTPGYIDEEELELGGSVAQNEQTYTGDHLKYAQVEQPERIEEPEQDRFSFSMKPVYLLYLLVLLLLILALMIFIRRRILKRALAAMDKAPIREAIAMRYGYALRLLRSCTEAAVEETERAAELNREALFSNHDMTPQQRLEMDDYAGRVLAVCKEKWTVPEKIRYWLWDCLY